MEEEKEEETRGEGGRKDKVYDRERLLRRSGSAAARGRGEVGNERRILLEPRLAESKQNRGAGEEGVERKFRKKTEGGIEEVLGKET